ncbi:MAG: threonylcarbamoyl-AMP synthase [Holosporales bacterium]|jgi:L-threonylcarbamoyladenylate synthase|nr:threonylcarbamoyl-AMP synthase [Holosporales bacterium]
MNSKVDLGYLQNKSIDLACEYLARGGAVAIPTETVYGLAADATNDLAIANVYVIKNRPSFNPLILHTCSLERAAMFGVFSSQALALAEQFWAPGHPNHCPLTLVVPLQQGHGISELATAGLATAAIRVPNHPLTNKLLRAYPNPLAAPSANISTRISATNAEIVREALGDKIPHIIDGGQCAIGIESTIIDASVEPFTILRHGGTPTELIERVLGYAPLPADIGDVIKSPGLMKRHYAPSIPLYMNQCERDAEAGDAFLGFGGECRSPHNLSPAGSLIEAAANLFRMLHEMDDPAKFNAIRVAPIPMRGIGLAINDRLQRAAVPAGLSCV